jgi:Fic-DOC domain mobile mystery protein B
MTLFISGGGNTLLTPEEQADLIPNLSTREELNEWERQNIIEASVWALDGKRSGRRDLLTDSYVRELHRRMFDQTWKWAGKYRTSEKNIGVQHYLIRESLAQLLDDVRYWIDHQTYAADEIAVRLHHRLVSIHCFPNGNGRHARLIADVLAQRQDVPFFTWGGATHNLARQGEVRLRYIRALQEADRNNIQPLLVFARS